MIFPLATFVRLTEYIFMFSNWDFKKIPLVNFDQEQRNQLSVDHRVKKITQYASCCIKQHIINITKACMKNKLKSL